MSNENYGIWRKYVFFTISITWSPLCHHIVKNTEGLVQYNQKYILLFLKLLSGGGDCSSSLKDNKNKNIISSTCLSYA